MSGKTNTVASTSLRKRRLVQTSIVAIAAGSGKGSDKKMKFAKTYKPLWSYHPNVVSKEESKYLYTTLSELVLKKIDRIGNAKSYVNAKYQHNVIEPPRLIACYSLPYAECVGVPLAEEGKNKDNVSSAKKPVKRLTAIKLKAQERQKALGKLCPKEILRLQAIADEFLKTNYQHLYKHVVMRKALINYYRDGQDYIPIHSDKERDENIVLSFSFYINDHCNIQRELRIYPKDDKTNVIDSISMEQGSVVLMHPGMQKAFLHHVPKRENFEYGRVNVTFREF